MKEKIVYNPQKRYTWKPEDEFVLKGEDFGLILNAIRGILNTPEAAKILLAHQANQAIDAIFAKAVENGVAVETPPMEQLNLNGDDKPSLKLVGK